MSLGSSKNLVDEGREGGRERWHDVIVEFVDLVKDWEPSASVITDLKKAYKDRGLLDEELFDKIVLELGSETLPSTKVLFGLIFIYTRGIIKSEYDFRSALALKNRLDLVLQEPQKKALISDILFGVFVGFSIPERVLLGEVIAYNQLLGDPDLHFACEGAADVELDKLLYAPLIYRQSSLRMLPEAAFEGGLQASELVKLGRFSAERSQDFNSFFRELAGHESETDRLEEECLARKPYLSRSEHTLLDSKVDQQRIKLGGVQEEILAFFKENVKDVPPSFWITFLKSRMRLTVKSDWPRLIRQFAPFWAEAFQKNFVGDGILYLAPLLFSPDIKAMIDRLSGASRHGFVQILLYVALHSQNSLEVAMAVDWLAAEVYRQSPGAPLLTIVNTLAQASRPEILFLFFASAKNPAELMHWFLEARFVHQEIKFDVRKEGVAVRPGESLGPFDPAVWKEIVTRRCAGDASPKAAQRELTQVVTPAGDVATLWTAIREHRSIALSEVVEVDLGDALPQGWHVFISPSRGDGTYSTTFRLVDGSGDRFKHVQIEGRLSEKGFSSGVTLDSGSLSKLHAIGTLALHTYFVRAFEAHVQERVRNTARQVEGESGTDPRSTVGVPPVKSRRPQNSLTVDLTEAEAHRDRERAERARTKIRRSNHLLNQALRGEAVEGEAISDLMLFRADSDFIQGREAYVRVQSPEELQALLANGLQGQGLYAMVGSPHTRAVGFHLETEVLPSGLRFDEVLSNRPSDQAQLAYELYLENGGEAMGRDEMDPYEAFSGVRFECGRALREPIRVSTCVGRDGPREPMQDEEGREIPFEGCNGDVGRLVQGVRFQALAQDLSPEEREAMDRTAVDGSGAKLIFGRRSNPRTFNAGQFVPVEKLEK